MSALKDSPNDLPTSWSVAKTSGATHYFTGKPCKRSHVDKRLASTGQCLSCLRERVALVYSENPDAGRLRAKKYRELNPEKVSEAYKKWRETNLEAAKAAKRKRYAGSAELNRAKARDFYEKNQDRMRLEGRLYYKENHAKIKVYRSNRSGAYAAHCAKRRATKMMATPLWFGELDELVISEAHDVAKRRSAATGIKWEVDHSIPLQGAWACGFHCAANTQVITKELNNTKSNRNIFTEPLSWLATL